MSIINGTSNPSLIRQEVYSNEMLTPLYPMVNADIFVRDISDFKDGATYNLPKMGQASIYQRSGSEDTRLDGVSTAMFQFTVTDFPESATAIERKTIEDSWIMPVLMGELIPNQQNAIKEYYETQIWKAQSAQTASDPNTINGVAHRFVASGSNQTLTVQDFARAKLALDTANVPQEGRVAIISPYAAHQIASLVTPVAQFNFNLDLQGVIEQGIRNNLKVNYQLHGFNIMVSNFLPVVTETITAFGATTSVTSGNVNLFFSIANDQVKPFVRAWRRQLTSRMYIDDKKDLMEVYVTNGRFGYGCQRLQGLVCALTSTTVS